VTHDSKKRTVIPNVARFLAALLDVDDLKQLHPPATTIFEKLTTDGADQPLLTTGFVAGADNDQVTELVFVVAGDKAIDDLIDQLRNELANNTNVQLLIVDNDQNVLKSFAQQAQSYGNLDAVHIISHAADGELRFGNQIINQETLRNNQESLQQLGSALNVDADILLYGCNLSSTDIGHEFAKTLSSLTSADVASSSNITGHASHNGDWDLEVVEGKIETQSVASESIQKNWLGTLNIDFGLTHHYLFNGDGVDIVGGSDITFHNGVTFVPGLENQAANFGSESGSVYKHGEIPGFNAPAFGNSDFTISLRVNATASDTSATFLSNAGGSSTQHGVTIKTDSIGRVVFTISNGSSSYSATSVASINDGIWSHITAERGNDKLQLTLQRPQTGYSNSIVSGISAGGVNLTNGNPMLFGAANTAGLQEFNGLLDDIRIYNRSLGNQDTEDLATAGVNSTEQYLINNVPVTMDINSIEQLTNAELQTVDSDTPDNAIVYTIVNDGGDVHFQLSGNTLGANDTTTATFNANFDYPANSAPIAGDGVLPSVNEDDHSHAGETVSNLISASFSDPDPDDSFSGILVTVNPNDAVQGAWQYSTDGTNWFAIGMVSEASALALSADTFLRFDPSNDYSDIVTDLQYRVIDKHFIGPNTPADFTDGATREITDASVNGLTTSISANLGKLSTSVVPVNDAPTIASTSLTPKSEDAVTEILELISDVFSATFNDADAGSSLAGIAITANSATVEGEWSYSQDGINWHYVSTVSTSNALVLPSNYYIQFLTATNYNGAPPALEVRAIDDTYSAAFTNGAAKAHIDVNAYGPNSAVAVADTQLATTINPINDLPVAVNDTMAVLEGGTENQDLRVNDTDVDGDSLSVLFISGPSYGSLISNPDGTIDYQHDGTENFSDSFTYVVNDGTASSAVAATVTVTITPVNEDPAIQNIVITDPDEADVGGRRRCSKDCRN